MERRVIPQSYGACSALARAGASDCAEHARSGRAEGDRRAATAWVLSRGVEVVRCQYAISAGQALISIDLTSADLPITVIQRCASIESAEAAVSVWRDSFLRRGWRATPTGVSLTIKPDRRRARRSCA